MPELSLSTNRVPNQVFDVLVIGGGITGAWIALDCSLRGLSTVLIEKGDFGSATSMRSSRILHGGIRYLQQLEFNKVRESSKERSFLTESAPHMVEHVPFIVPTYPGFRKGHAFLYAGMLAYRLLTSGTQAILSDSSTRVPRDRAIGQEEIGRDGRIGSDDMTGGRILYEAQIQSTERMTLGVIEKARAHGALTLNYMEMLAYSVQDKRVSGVSARDLVTSETLEVRSRLVINAAGPWCDQVNNDESLHRLNTGFARGAHIITRPLLGHYAVALPSAFRSEGVATRGHRHIFVIPWRNHSLIGTSYMEAQEPSLGLVPTEQEIEQLIESVNQSVPRAELSRSDVLQSFAGYYPLQSETIEHGVYQGTGEYRLVDHEVVDSVGGLITALGAKFTTARRLAEMTAQLAEEKINRKKRPKTHTTRGIKLPGGKISNIDRFRREAIQRYAALWPEKTCRHLINSYGTRIEDIAELCRQQSTLAKPLMNDRDTIAAQIVWSARHESVVHLSDILFRRTDLCLLGDPGDEVLTNCAGLAAETLDWSPDRQANEVKMVRAELNQSIPGLRQE